VSRRVFVDTWGWLALGHRRDAHHQAVKEIVAARLPVAGCLHTSDYVLNELITLLFRREAPSEAMRFVEGILADQAAGRISVHRVTAERFFAALELRRRLQDKPLISFTDLTSMALMAELRIEEVLTEDEHFLHVGVGFATVP
jgi:predicted nucleic acid-binding protein